MDHEEMLEDKDKLITVDGIACYVIGFKAPDNISCWIFKGKQYDSYSLNSDFMNVRDFELESLKVSSVWGQLSKELQGEMERGVVEEQAAAKEQVEDRMEVARRGRRNKYPNIPREITCVKCTKVDTVVPSVIGKRVEKLGVTIEDYVKGYQCSVCSPRKRGKAKKDYGDVPDQLICKICKKVTKYHPSAIIATAKRKGLTVKKLVEKFECQTCNPTRGRKKGVKIKKR